MGNSAPTVIAARQRVPDLSEVPASLRPVIAPMLNPRPDNRPSSMRALLSGPRSRPLPPPKRRLALWAASTAAVLLASIVSALIVVRWVTPPPSIEEVRTQLAAATSEYRCASLDYSVAPDRSAHLSGFARTEDDIQRLRRAVENRRDQEPRLRCRPSDLALLRGGGSLATGRETHACTCAEPCAGAPGHRSPYRRRSGHRCPSSELRRVHLCRLLRWRRGRRTPSVPKHPRPANREKAGTKSLDPGETAFQEMLDPRR